MASYQIQIHDDYGNPIDGISDNEIIYLSSAIAENDIGEMEISLSNRWNWDFFRPDLMLRVERNAGAGYHLLGERNWFLRYWSVTGPRAEILTIKAYDGNYLLDGPIVAYSAGSAQAKKSGIADDVMKTVVSENIGPTATDTDRRLSGLTIEKNYTLGPSVEYSFAKDYVLDVLRDIAFASWQKGKYLVFDTVATGTGTVEFRTYMGQRGVNRGKSGSSPLMVQLDNPMLEKTHINERNFIYAGGQGQGSDRVIKTATNPAWTGASRWNRREMFANAANVETDNAVQEAANAALYENRPRLILTGQIPDDLTFGVDYDFGYIVVAQYAGVSFDCHVAAVSVNYVKGKEKVVAKVRGEA